MMILRRLTANLRGQNWTAIAIEFLIVVVGVFIGTQVANWNQARLEKQATNRMLEQLRPELQNQIAFFNSARTYYAITRRYADAGVRRMERRPPRQRQSVRHRRLPGEPDLRDRN